MRKNLIYILTILFLTGAGLYLSLSKVQAAQSCSCTQWEIQGTKNGSCNGKTGICSGGEKRVCIAQKCEDDSPKCAPASCAAFGRTACGQAAQYFADGCGGYVYCGATTPCAPTVVKCARIAVKCSMTCGQTLRYMSDGCGGTVSCPATDKCSACNPACGAGSTCIVPNACPPGAKCIVADGPAVCVANTPTPAPTVGPTPIYCSVDSQCPVGQDCIQPPMPACINQVCAQVMPRQICQVSTCPKRSMGDANCDQAINDLDLAEFRKAMNNLPICLNCSVNFNRDKKVDMLDYEIWRSHR